MSTRFLTWLLCRLDGTPLWSLGLLFLLVGHTHNRLDRFFSRLAVSLRGHDYFTRKAMLDVVRAGVPSNDISDAHVTHVWDWKQLHAHLPKFHGLRNAHCFNVFRSNGVWLKWKQYLTDESWSRPVLLVPARRMAEVAAFSPPRLEQSFGDAAGKMVAWADKLDAALSDAHDSARRPFISSNTPPTVVC
jgi:hypothetical protein